jgi:hypothetical protein
MPDRNIYDDEPIGSDYEEVTVSTAAVGLNPDKATLAISATIQVITNPIRLRLDGTAPTATVGLYYAATEISVKGRANLLNLRAIRDTSASGSAVLRVHYYR